nr:MAG TPA_asm: hypothetical protein [Caudoviricetes sp.]
MSSCNSRGVLVGKCDVKLKLTFVLKVDLFLTFGRKSYI